MTSEELNDRINNVHILLKSAFRRIERLELDNQVLERDIKELKPDDK